MFWRKDKKKCECGTELTANWSFCPNCGEPLDRRRREGRIGFLDLTDFNDIFKQMNHQMAEMDRLFNEPFFRRSVPRTQASGISISITKGSTGSPRVAVRTFGDAKKFEPEIKQRLGVQPAITEVEDKVEKVREQPEPRATRPRIAEEVEMEVKHEGNRLIYEIKLPNIKAKDIEIKRLPNSIEIRAIAGNKLYFKLFEAPPHLSILHKKFADNKLTLVLG